MKKKFWYILFVAVFFLACLVPSVGMIFAGPSPAAGNEPPAAKPRVIKLNGSFNVNFLSDLQTYLGSTFYLRLEGITAWDTLNEKLFNTSPNDDVILGRDGWLFFGAATEDLSGADQMSDRQIWCAARSLALMQEYTESQGAKFLFVPVCGKYTVYREYVPQRVTVAEPTDRERLMAAAGEQGVNYVNLYDVFTAVDEELYWQWDSHWNSRGAALAADAILAALGVRDICESSRIRVQRKLEERRQAARLAQEAEEKREALLREEEHLAQLRREAMRSPFNMRDALEKGYVTVRVTKACADEAGYAMDQALKPTNKTTHGDVHETNHQAH